MALRSTKTSKNKSKRVFITYAQDNSRHAKNVLDLANKLRSGGVDVRLDQYTTHPAQGWPRWMEEQFVETEAILVVLSEKYLERYNQSAGIGTGARFEAAILRAHILKNGVSYEKIAVVTFGKILDSQIPDLLHGCNRYDASHEKGVETLYRWLTNQPASIAPTLGQVRKLSPIKPLAKSPSFRSLCQNLQPLISDNYRVFRDFGPNSGADSKGPVRYNLETWYEFRQSKIVPNNKRIRELIVEARTSIPPIHVKLFEQLISHIDAFEAHVGNERIDYREHQFPKIISEIIDKNAK